MELFSVTPQVKYGEFTLLNLLTKIAPIQEHLSKYQAYFDYTISDGERPDTIAFDYYGSSSYAWLVMIPNNVHNVYTQWPLPFVEFQDMIRAKYGNVTTVKTTVSHYIYTGIPGNTEEEISRKKFFMSTDTFSLATVDERAGWTPVYVYDYEDQLNEAKRTIKLLSNDYLRQVDREVQALLGR